MQHPEKQSRLIKSHGGPRPGAGRPAGAPNKLTRPIKEMAALESEECIAVLVELRDHAEGEQVRLQAANALLDRAHGRPRQEVDLNKNEGVRIFIDGQEMIDGKRIPAPDVFPAIEYHSFDEE